MKRVVLTTPCIKRIDVDANEVVLGNIVMTTERKLPNVISVATESKSQATS